MRHLLDAGPARDDHQVGMGRPFEIESSSPVRALLSVRTLTDPSQVEIPVGAGEWVGEGFHGRQGRGGTAQGDKGRRSEVGQGTVGAGRVVGYSVRYGGARLYQVWEGVALLAARTRHVSHARCLIVYGWSVALGELTATTHLPCPFSFGRKARNRGWENVRH